MGLLQQIDTGLFRLINQHCQHPLLDHVMPWFSDNPLFGPMVTLAVVWLAWRGGLRGRIFLAVLGLLLALGDPLFVGPLKDAIGRPRPFAVLSDVHLLVGKGGSGSMPSSHAFNCFLAATVAWLFYPRSGRWLYPIACMVALSRVYVGVHYPSDVIAGALLGFGFGLAGVYLTNVIWKVYGPTFFPFAYERVPVLPVRAEPGPPVDQVWDWGPEAYRPVRDRQWINLGYLVLICSLVGRLIYLAADLIDLSKDEAYQWVWSKHLALSYYSKPPLIAWLQFAGTHLWGDTEFGVRFFSPVLAFGLGLMLLKFVGRHANARAAFFLVLILQAIPLLAIGTVLMTVDPPLVFCWTAAMVMGWKALQPDGTTRDWAWTGLWLGLGFLSKYSTVLQLGCFVLFMMLWRPARRHLITPGPWLALGIFALCTLPVVIWNIQHGWVSAEHVAMHAQKRGPWQPTLRYFWDFLFSQGALLNPLFFVGFVWAAVAVWRRRERPVFWLYLFCMGAPVYLLFLAMTGYKRVLPNWPVAAVVPSLVLMVIYFEQRYREGARWVKPVMLVGVIVGGLMIAPLHESRLIGKVIGRPLPANVDPLRRVRAWPQCAEVVEQARRKLLQQDGPAFVLCDHYGLTGLFSFYIPEAKTNVTGTPLVFCVKSWPPRNQFDLWPGYRELRPGQNAVFVHEAALYRLKPDWFRRWIGGDRDLFDPPRRDDPPLLEQVRKEFESVELLGEFDVHYRGQVYRRLQLYACRKLRPAS